MNNRFYSGGFFYNPNKREILLHKRDGNTKINPHKWTFFGGLSEDEDIGKPIQTFIREIKEELSVKLSEEEIIPLCDYLNERENTWRNVFYVISDKPKSEMILGEGAEFDWISLDKIFEYDLSERTIQDLNTFLQTI